MNGLRRGSGHLLVGARSASRTPTHGGPRRGRARGHAAFSTGPVTFRRASISPVAGCPNQSGLLDSISVPVGQPLILFVTSSMPAPPGGATFDLASEDPSIVAAGDPLQAFLPEVFIPEGETASNSFQVFGITVGSTFLDITPLNPDFDSSSTPTTAWDVGALAQGGQSVLAEKFLDANPQTNTCWDSSSLDLSSDANVLSTCGAPVQGTVSDGVSELLMRLVAGLPGTACYEIASTAPPDQGVIQTEVTSTQTVGDFEYGFSFYQAPNGYGEDSDSRTVQVQFFFTPSIGNGNTSSFASSLAVVRPPLLLIHGLWGDPQHSWPSLWDRGGPSYTTSRADYKATNASSFSTNLPKVQSFVATALQPARDKGYAATQVDVVAHSMGGLLTRLYAGSPQFEREGNFDLGDVHRLVTLDTPHFGSSLANLVVALNNNSPAFQLFSPLSSLPFVNRDITQGAVCDLAENSPALQGLFQATNLASQVISGIGGPPGAQNAPGLYWAPLEAALTLPACLPQFVPPFIVCPPGAYLFPQDIVDGFRFRQANDAIVALTSQQGGLLGNTFANLIHTDVTTSQAVVTEVFALLDGSDSGFSSSLPPVSSDGLGDPLTVPGRGSGLDQQDFSEQCSPGGPMKPSGSPSSEAAKAAATGATVADSRVQITAPTNGQQFAPGDAVNVTVQITAPLTAIAGYVVVEAAGFAPLEGSNYNGSTYQASFVIPDTYAGALTIIPDIIDSNSNPIAGVGVTVVVNPNTAPLELVLVQGNYSHITSSGVTAHIYVTGEYPNSLERDLTSSIVGTTYQSSNTQVLTVDSEGDVQSTGFGTAIVTVANNGVQTFATFSVEDPTNPLAPQDLTTDVSIARSGFRVDRNTGFFVQTVQLTNSLAVPMIGPLYFVASDLPDGVTLVNKAGPTQNIAPMGSPYIRLQLPDGITLQPGASLTLILQFLDPGRTRISYTPTVFRTLATP